jgi:FdhD protein
MPNKILMKVPYTRADGGFTAASERVVKETALTVQVDGRHLVTAMILAAMEKEYVTGQLYVQGLINRAADIISIVIKDDTAIAVLKRDIQTRDIPQEIHTDLTVSATDIFHCVRAILKSPVFTETEAVHSAGLFLNGRETVSVAEDLGRHNALDKVIGAGLLKNVDFSKTLAASTGRQPAEMIIKCQAAGIPIIATKGVPTSMAVEMAEKVGVTIAGLVRGDTMIVYSHPERII